MTSPTLLVLAAGMGSRYGGLKQIDAVGPFGATILDYSIYDAIRAGFLKVVFVIRREIEEIFKQSVGNRFEQQISVAYVFQELDKLPLGIALVAGRAKPWGTAQAVLMGANAIQNPFAVINADDFYGSASYDLLSSHLSSSPQDYAMIGFTLRNTLSEYGAVARGICQVSAENKLESVVELTHIQSDGGSIRSNLADGSLRLTGDEIVSMNMWGFTAAVFDQLESIFATFLSDQGSDRQAECYLPNAINTIIANQQARVKVLRTGNTWFGVTYQEDRSRVVAAINGLIASGAYPERLWP